MVCNGLAILFLGAPSIDDNSIFLRRSVSVRFSPEFSVFFPRTICMHTHAHIHTTRAHDSWWHRFFFLKFVNRRLCDGDDDDVVSDKNMCCIQYALAVNYSTFVCVYTCCVYLFWRTSMYAGRMSKAMWWGEGGVEKPQLYFYTYNMQRVKRTRI